MRCAVAGQRDDPYRAACTLTVIEPGVLPDRDSRSSRHRPGHRGWPTRTRCPIGWLTPSCSHRCGGPQLQRFASTLSVLLSRNSTQTPPLLSPTPLPSGRAHRDVGDRVAVQVAERGQRRPEPGGRVHGFGEPRAYGHGITAWARTPPAFDSGRGSTPRPLLGPGRGPAGGSDGEVLDSVAVDVPDERRSPHRRTSPRESP